jgi:hypothetical protein
MLCFWSAAGIGDGLTKHFGDFGFEAVNVALLAYAIGRFIGWRNLVDDPKQAAGTTE